MNNTPRPFQLVLWFGFGAMFFIALAIFALTEGDPGDRAGAVDVSIWGTFSERQFSEFLLTEGADNPALSRVTYRQIESRDFDNQLLNAIARGESPDIILIPHTTLVQHRAKLIPIQYDTFPRRTFNDEFIDGFEIFARSDGIYAVPFGVDPLLLFWNRDIFNKNGIAEPPRTWEEVVNSVVPRVVVRDFERRIQMSPIALGEYRNNRNAFASMSLLLLQSGSRLVEESERGTYDIRLNTAATGSETSPLVNSLNFFTRFAMPSDPLYSWNRTKLEDRDEFVAGNLAMYFGMSSEIDALRRQNPNLNFDVTQVPQQADSSTVRTFGKFYGFGILRQSENPNAAYGVIQALANRANTQALTNQFELVPAHRASVNVAQSSPFQQSAYSAALVARGWLNPQDDRIDAFFEEIVNDVMAGRRSSSEAARDLESRIFSLYD